jgi:hypothetical protein
MTRKLSVISVFLLTGVSAPAHRLDEYLQGTIISIAKNRMEAEMTLTPGVAVFLGLIAVIDANGDGAISGNEQRAYAGRILRDLTLSIDGHSLTPHLISMEFPEIGEMKEGRGEMRLKFYADLPRGGARRKLIFENRHQSRIAAYQVNVLVPSDPAIRIESQKRNYSQSFYELDFAQAGVESGARLLGFMAGIRGLLETILLVAAAWVALFWGLRDSRGPSTS